MARTARAPILVLLLGGIGLTVPPQTKDMLSFIDRDLAAQIAFQLAIGLLAFSAWFWSRAALAARFGIDESDRTKQIAAVPLDWTALNRLPRVLLAGAFVVGGVLAVRSWTPLALLGVALLGVVALLLAIYRPRTRLLLGGAVPRRGVGAWIRGGAKARLLALLDYAPFGRPWSLLLLGLGLLLLLLGALEAFGVAIRLPIWLALLFPGPGVAVLLLALMIGPLTAATFVLDGLTFRVRVFGTSIGLRRPPVLIALLLYVFVAVPNLFYIHTLRTLPAQPTGMRQSLDELFEQWAGACGRGPTLRPVIVAVSGGATRAGLWGAAVLDNVLRLQSRYPDGPRLFAVSSVSGGSLGVAGAMSLMREGQGCNTPNLDALRPSRSAAPLAGDALGALLGGWLADDIPRAAFDPVAALVRSATGRLPDGGDSAEAIEHGFEHLWSKVRPGAAAGWDQPFLSLFYAGGRYRAGMPLWLANGTDAVTGNRIITAPIRAPLAQRDPAPWPFRGARSLLDLAGADVPISTAINNTARFPYLEPFGQMLNVANGSRVGSLVDGGYFENEGLQTALELAEWLARDSGLARRGGAVEPIIVQATGDGEADVTVEQIMRCTQASDGPGIPSTRSTWQLLAPLSGLSHVRGGHSAVLLRQAHDQFCPGQPDGHRPDRFFHFYLAGYQASPGAKRTDVPLNWVLSNQVARFIWDRGFEDDPAGNATELERLEWALGGAKP